MPTPDQTNPFDRLPGFEGVDPVGTELAISGGSGRRTRSFHIGETFPMVIEVKVTAVEHKETKGGIVRIHKLALQDAYELGDNRAPDLLEDLHREHEEWLNQIRGTPALPFADDGEEAPDTASAAAGAGPEARADARAEREQGDGWDGFDGDDNGDDLGLLSLMADAVAADADDPRSREGFLAEVEQYAHDAGLVEVPLGDLPPAGNVTPIKATAAKKATKAAKATKKSPAPKK